MQFNQNEQRTILRISLPSSGKWYIGTSFIALAISLAMATIVLTANDNTAQRTLAATLTVRGLHICIIAGAVGAALVFKFVLEQLGRQAAVTSLGLIVLGYIGCGLAPQTNRIFFDEHIYMHIGQSIAHTGRAEAANYARAEYGQFEAYSSWTNKQPNGHPYILSWLYRLIGVSTKHSFYVNRAWVGLTSAALYISLLLAPWKAPRGTALCAAILYITTPLVLWWGNTVAVEPGAAGSAVIAYLAATILTRTYSSGKETLTAGASMLLGASLAFASYFRPESLLVYPVALATLWSSDRALFRSYSMWAAIALAVSLTTPDLLHLWSVHTEDWGATDGRRFDISFVAANLRSNAGYFFDGKWFPVGGTVLLFSGVTYFVKHHKKGAVMLFIWLALSWGTFVLFYAGGYHYGASSRYAVVSCGPIALTMGVGLAYISQHVRSSPAASALLASLGLINWASAMHYVPTVARESAEARADVDFVLKVAPTIPQGSLVISCNPCIWNVEGVNSSQFFTVEGMIRTELNELRNQYPGGIYVHWNFWNNVEPTLANNARTLIRDTEAVVVHRLLAQDHEVAILRIDTPSALAKFGGKNPVRANIQRMYPEAKYPNTTANSLSTSPEPGPK